MSNGAQESKDFLKRIHRTTVRHPLAFFRDSLVSSGGSLKPQSLQQCLMLRSFDNNDHTGASGTSWKSLLLTTVLTTVLTIDGEHLDQHWPHMSSWMQLPQWLQLLDPPLHPRHIPLCCCHIPATMADVYPSFFPFSLSPLIK